jgi:hypothetical protein
VGALKGRHKVNSCLDPSVSAFSARGEHCRRPSTGDFRGDPAALGSTHEETRLARLLDWLGDLPILARLWLRDRAAGPYPETEGDLIRDRRKERQHRAVPKSR